MSGANLFLEAFDQTIGVGERLVADTFVHRCISSSAQCCKFRFEFVVVEYSWIHHAFILRPARGACRGFHESVDQ